MSKMSFQEPNNFRSLTMSYAENSNEQGFNNVACRTENQQI